MTVALQPGSTLGPFRLAERVALGGMAEVWSAIDTRRPEGDPVALKVMRSSWASDPEFHDMFRDEVQLSTRLRHENIVEVRSGEQVDGHLFQVMELLHGWDLRRVLSRLDREQIPFPVEHVVYVARSVARALAYAHTKRGDRGQALCIVHRDISPHNVMLVRDGRVKLLDFGIAKAAERHTRTQGGVIKGKTAYMSPEQVVAAKLDARSDVFAAGIVWWEALAQRRLFKGDTDPDTMTRVLRRPVPRLDGLREDVPSALADLVEQMLARRPRERPSSMIEVERRLQRILMRSFAPESFGPSAFARWLAEVMPRAPRPAAATMPVPSPSGHGPTAPDHTVLGTPVMADDGDL